METKVVISGSFRKYLREIGTAWEAFTKSGIKVLAPATKNVVDSRASFVLLLSDNPKKPPNMLEKEFMSNIEKSDFLYVANVRGYIGKSVAAEMSFAIIHRIPIVIAEKINEFSLEIPVPVQAILKTSIFARRTMSTLSSLRGTDLNLSSFIPAYLSLEQKADLDSLINNLLEELKHVKLCKYE